MKVTVREGFQINHDGKLRKGGESFDAPDVKAKRWVDSGIAAKAISKSKNKAVKSSANKAATKTKALEE